MHLLIAAAGSGRRMGAGKNKLLLPIAGKPILEWTLKAALQSKSIKWIGIIGQAIDEKTIMSFAKDNLMPIEWIIGGDTRQESVELGLNSLPSDAKYVLIHDGARCLVKPSLFDKCSLLVQEGHSVIAATPVNDTIKEVDGNGFITSTPDRNHLWGAQTPQCFAVDNLKEAHLYAKEKSWTVTDDAALFERLSIPVKILEADPSNIKVTTPFDLKVAESILINREEI